MAKSKRKAEASAEYNPRTASDVIAAYTDTVDAENVERAADAGVIDVAYIDYEEALDNYQNRSDVEPLAERRARTVGADFHDAEFRRQAGGPKRAGVVTSAKVRDKSDDE